ALLLLHAGAALGVGTRARRRTTRLRGKARRETGRAIRAARLEHRQAARSRERENAAGREELLPRGDGPLLLLPDDFRLSCETASRQERPYSLGHDAGCLAMPGWDDLMD